MITKSAHLHFTICENYSRNILNMAEEKFRVHNVGSLGVEKILNNLKKKKNNRNTYLSSRNIKVILAGIEIFKNC